MISRKQQSRWLFRSLGIVLILTGLFIRLADPYPVRAARLIFFDYLQRLAPQIYDPELPVRIVDIDEASLAEIGQWPWPRTTMAQLVDRLADYGAAAIAIDMLFAEPDRYSPAQLAQNPDLASLLGDIDRSALVDNDRVLAEAISQLPVALGVAARIDGTQTSTSPKVGIVEIGERPAETIIQVPSWTELAPPLGQHTMGIGGVNVSPVDGIGAIRTIPLLWRGPTGVMPSLSIEALRIAVNEQNLFVEGTPDNAGIMLGLEVGPFIVPTTEDGQLWLHYRYDHPDSYVSAMDVLSEIYSDALRAKIEGRIIFVGTSAAGLLDIRETPLGESIPGVSIHVQVIEQILQGKALRRTDSTAALELLAYFALGLIVISVMSISGAILSFIAGGIAASLVLGISWIAFTQQSILFDATFPLFGGLANFGALAGFQFVTTEREKRAIRRTFSHYVSPEIMQELEASGHEIELGGRTQDTTVMFSDIRDFTPISERLKATELVALLNELFSSLGREILAEKGTIDKFIGDAIMAFWNAPIQQEDHAVRSVRAALRMRAALHLLNKDLEQQGLPQIETAIGLATGRACVGNIGSQERFNYTAIGEVVNLAARIETACRHVAYDILVSEGIYQAARGELAMLEAGQLKLKGISERVSVYIVVGDATMAGSSDFCELSLLHGELLAALDETEPTDRLDDMFNRVLSVAIDLEPGLEVFYNVVRQRPSDFIR